MIKKILSLALLTFISIISYGQLNVELFSEVTYPLSAGNDVWGYVDSDGSEYAIFGTNIGVSVVNITDPRNPVEVDFIDQQTSIWRDIKTYGDFAYVTSDQAGTTDGLLIIDMTNLPDSISYRNLNMPIPDEGTINTCHNLYIDESGFLYLAGCGNLNDGGLIILDVATTPGDPIFISTGNDVYSHDVYVRDNKAYSSEIDIGRLTIYDVEDKDNIIELATQSTPFNFTHNAWLSDDSNFIFTTDEVANAPVASYDISDLSDIKLLDEFRPSETIGDGVVPHNVHVFQNWLVISYYTDGCIIVDATRPDNLVEVGNWDTFLNEGTGFNGAWGAYPFFPSGTIIVGDIGIRDENGIPIESTLFILGPDYKRAGYLEGNVTNAATGELINNVEISVGEINLTELTNAAGEYKTGSPTEGEYEVVASKFGFITQTQTVQIIGGEVTNLNFELEESPRVSATISVVNSEDNSPIENAQVSLAVAGFEETFVTGTDGIININDLIVFDGYSVVAAKWGYKYDYSTVDISEDNNPTEIVINLEVGIEDNFDLDLGWSVESAAFQGDWERGLPNGIMPAGVPIEIAPGSDSDDEGDYCYVTGNGLDIGSSLLFGETTLISPVFDATEMLSPALSYDLWFWDSTQNGTAAVDPFEVFISNGLDTVRLDSLEFDLFGIFSGQVIQDWRATDSLLVENFIAPTENMQLIISIAQSNQFNAVEGGFDAFQLFDAGLSSNVTLVKDIEINLYPNPSHNAFYIDVPEIFRGSDSKLDLISVEGKIISTRKGDGSSIIRIGEELSNGVYFAQFSNEKIRSKAEKIIKI